MRARKLPQIEVDGERFFFDSRLSQLRKVNEPSKFFDLSRTEKKYLLEAIIHLALARRFAKYPSSEDSENEIM